MTAADDLRDTLQFCRDGLIAIEAHPAHIARLNLIWRFVEAMCRSSPEYCQAELERADRMVGQQEEAEP